MRKILNSILLIAALNFSVFGQDFSALVRKPLLELSVKKWGAYLGLQKGRYTVPEFGAQYLWKKIRIKNPIIHEVHAGFNYNFRYNVLGYDAGYWMKPHRLGLTYGVNLFYRTDFVSDRLGMGPVVGFKFWFAHLQTGYHFMNKPTHFETNTFFVSLRLSIINARDFDLDWNGKKKKK